MESLLSRIAYFVHELSLSVPYQMRSVLFKLYHKESLLYSSKLKLPFKAKKLFFNLFPAKLYEKKYVITYIYTWILNHVMKVTYFTTAIGKRKQQH